MSGAANRRKGHTTELMVAAWLRDHGHPEACTTRSMLGHDGTHTPGDIAGVPGLVVEVKDVQSGSRWPTWVRQAAEEAGSTPWCVVRRTRGVTDVGRWPVVASPDATGRRHPGPCGVGGTLRQALSRLANGHPYSRGWQAAYVWSDRGGPTPVMAGRFGWLFDLAEVLR